MSRRTILVYDTKTKSVSEKTFESPEQYSEWLRDLTEEQKLMALEQDIISQAARGRDETFENQAARKSLSTLPGHEG
jgi:hypothetical protein